MTQITRWRETLAAPNEEDRAKGSSTLQLLLHDPDFTDRLVAFLRSVGQLPLVNGPGEIEVDAPGEELHAYLRVWEVVHPGVEVELNG